MSTRRPPEMQDMKSCAHYQACPTQLLGDRRLHIIESGIAQRLSRNPDAIPPGCNPGQIVADRFSQQPLAPIASHSSPHPPAGHKGKTAGSHPAIFFLAGDDRFPGRRHNQNNQGMAIGAPFRAHPLHFHRPAQPVGGGKHLQLSGLLIFCRQTASEHGEQSQKCRSSLLFSYGCSC